VRINVEIDKCVGGGQCVVASPEVFDQREDDGLVIVLDEAPAADLHESVREAAHNCPALAIHLDEG
jgi:ferredoxin